MFASIDGRVGFESHTCVNYCIRIDDATMAQKHPIADTHARTDLTLRTYLTAITNNCVVSNYDVLAQICSISNRHFIMQDATFTNNYAIPYKAFRENSDRP